MPNSYWNLTSESPSQAPKEQRLRPKHLQLILAGLLIFLLRWPSSGQQRIQPVIDPDEVRNGRSPIRAREEWFLRGRRAPAGQSPAALREHAFAQRQAMERAQTTAQSSAEGPLSSGTGSAWQALGPAPLIPIPAGSRVMATWPAG